MISPVKQFMVLVCVLLASNVVRCDELTPPSKVALDSVKGLPHAKTFLSIATSENEIRPSQLPSPSLAHLIARYRELVTITQQVNLREKLDYRLAQLLSIDGERAQELGTPLSNGEFGYYDESIDAYKMWLSVYQDSALIESVTYELAKVYELQGQSDLSFSTISSLVERFPGSKLRNELNFRRGEYLFSRQDYVRAAVAYQQVITAPKLTNGLFSPFYETALYMKGWSEYKLDNPKQSLAHFSEVLDRNLPTKATTTVTIDSLPLANKQLVVDALKVMNLIFSNAQGATSLAQHYKNLGGRYFEYLHFDAMAKELLENKRYRDSANTYDVFVDNYPAHYLSPTYAIKKVAIYERGRFPTLATLEKEKFVKTYGIDGGFWPNWSIQRQREFGPTLRSYLSEMALDQYRVAQKDNGDESRISAFVDAANLLNQYQRTFNDDAQLAFLYAESLNASQQWRLAIDAYNHFAYGENQTFERERVQQANAAYAAVLAFNKLAPNRIMPKPMVSEHGVITLSEQEKNAVRFTHEFKDDSRAITILFNLMDHRFAQARYTQTINIVDRILSWDKPIEQAKIINAKLIKSHSIYNQGNYAQAIVAYEDVLTDLNADDERLTVINNNLAASLFKHADHLVKEKKWQLAINRYLEILEKTPDSPVRKLAHYNAAQYLYQLTRLDDSIAQLLSFKSLYPNDPLAQDIDVQLASIYEQQQDWDKAAAQRLAIANNLPESAEQQQALFLTASFYEKAQDEKNALKTYRRHANTYQAPIDRYFEVMNKISDKYLAINKQRKYRFWLRKIVKTHDTTDKNTPRSTYLAAKSALVFAQDEQRLFDKIKLNLPLKRSLDLKKKSLEKTLIAYKKVADYRVASFTTQSTFKTAQVYRQLASDLMSSQRPNGLDELALEQYDILLEEQAFPFEDQAIVLFENNANLTAKGLFDQWIEQSFERLSKLMPGRYNKQEQINEKVDAIY